MRTYVVFSFMGPDRPGLAREIAEFFAARGINIERSRGCVLGNEYGMIILTSGGSDNIERLIDGLDGLREKTGLDIHIRKTKAPLHREAPPSILYKLVAICIDRPGIIHQICKVLHDRKINIEDISTNVDHDLATSASVFQMVCYFSLPPSVKIIDLKQALTRVSDDYNVDIRFDAVIGK
jgi:glycine cleavage system transcriptional repressor